jgi:large conductance mechanosensitive channel
MVIDRSYNVIKMPEETESITQDSSATTTDDKILAELRLIRAAVQPEPVKKGAGMITEFKDFLERSQVIGFAVAFIIGERLGAFITQIIDTFIMPVLGMFIGGIDWDLFEIPAFPVGSTWLGPFPVGSLILEAIYILITIFVIFLLVRILGGMTSRGGGGN